MFFSCGGSACDCGCACVEAMWSLAFFLIWISYVLVNYFIRVNQVELRRSLEYVCVKCLDAWMWCDEKSGGDH